MRLGLFTYGYMRYSLERAFEDAYKFSYDGVEVWGGRPHAYPPDLVAEGVLQITKYSSS